MNRPKYRTKRILDLVFACLGVVLATPIMLLVAVLVRLTMGSPILFSQVRTGKHGALFKLVKFRTMADGDGPDDDRLSSVGRFIRSTSLDELPELWNILRGDMSLVGPRPELLHVVARYEQWQHRRHEVKPGITGLWQVSERGEKPMHEATDIDLEYVDSVSLKCDLRVLLLTVPAALGSQQGH